MNSKALIAILVVLASVSRAAGQAEPREGRPLSELMMAMQFQHMKLWSAGRLGNWPLAAYELDQIESGLRRTAASDGATTSAMQALRKAVDAKAVASFTMAYGALTNACNGCHRAEGRAFITIQVPGASPFADQLFVDQVAEARGLAKSICGNCHRLSEAANEQPDSRFPAPSFPALAKSSSFSAQSLRELLTSGHRFLGPNRNMPNPRLAGNQVEEIVALFEILRTERAR